MQRAYRRQTGEVSTTPIYHHVFEGAESLDGVGLDWVKLESGPGKVDNLCFGTWRALEVQNGNLDNIFGP
jgi:hypothetical protein